MTSCKAVISLALVWALQGCDGCDDDEDEDFWPPAAPTNFTATPVDSGRIDLAWTDASSDEQEFLLEVSRDGLTFVEVARLPAGTTAHSFFELLPGLAYVFRLRATGLGGPSPYAPPATASTPQPAWTGPVTPTGPGARWSHAAVYDAGNQRMVVFGGDFAGPSREVWTFDLAGAGGWTDITPAAVPPLAPSGRMNPAALYDAANQRMIVFGGDPAVLMNDVWSLNLVGTPAWTKLVDGIAIPAPPAVPPAPSPRFNPTAVYDAANQRMIVFGGNDGGAILNDVWALPLPATGTPAWSLLSPSGTAPIPRENHTAVYDPVNLRMIVFGGIDNTVVPDGSSYNNETWALSLPAGGGGTTWSALSPTGGPPTPPRQGHTAVYDAVHRRMLMFGGIDAADTLLYDTWALGLSWDLSWVAVTPGGGTAALGRLEHAAIFDSTNARMVIVGGDDNNFTGFDEQWTLGN